MKKTGIIFDCDGTLVDTEDQVIDSFHYALRMTNSPSVGSLVIKNLMGPGADKMFQSLIKDPSKAEQAFEYFIEDQSKIASSMHVYDGIRELLTNLKNAKYCIGLVTGRHSRDLEIVLKAHQLTEFFDVIIPDDDLYKPKPNPEGLIRATLEMQIDPEKLYYVGDSKTDIEAANNAKMKAIAALWDNRVDHEVMRLEKPFFMSLKPMDIWNQISQDNKFRTRTNLKHI